MKYDTVGPGVCDSNRDDHVSPDWKGTSWYRIDGLAGTKIPEDIVDAFHCNTDATGWLNGTHPTTVGETVNRTICFNLLDDPCWKHIEIQVKLCEGFYLYYLEDLQYCSLRYCSQ